MPNIAPDVETVGDFVVAPSAGFATHQDQVQNYPEVIKSIRLDLIQTSVSLTMFNNSYKHNRARAQTLSIPLVVSPPPPPTLSVVPVPLSSGNHSVVIL